MQLKNYMQTGMLSLAILLSGQMHKTTQARPDSNLSLEEIAGLFSSRNAEKLLRQQAGSLAARINNTNEQGDFMNITLPEELIPAKEFWKNIYLKRDFSEVIFYEPKSYKIAAVHQSASRDEYYNMSWMQRSKARQELQEIKSSVVRKTGIKELRMIRGASDMLARGFSNSMRHLNECRQAFADVGINPEIGAAMVQAETCMQNLVSRAFAVGYYQFLKNVGKEKGLLINNSVDQRLDYRLAAETTARCMKEFYNRYSSEALAVTTHYAGPVNADKAFYYTRQLAEDNGKNELEPEEFFSIVVNDFAYQDDRIRGTFKEKSRQYMAIIAALMEVNRELYPPEIVAGAEPEYLEIKLDYQEHDKKIDIRNVFSQLQAREQLIAESGMQKPMSSQEKQELEKKLNKEMFMLNPSILYLQKQNNQQKFLRSFMGRRINRISPVLPDKALLRIPLEHRQWFLNEYTQQIDQESIRINKREQDAPGDKNPISVVRTPHSLGEALYKGIINARKDQGHAYVTPDMLGMVEQAYLYDLNKKGLTPRQRKHLEHSLAVVRMDAKIRKREERAGYWKDRIPNYLKKVDKYAVIID